VAEVLDDSVLPDERLPGTQQRLKGMVHPKMKIVIYIHPHFKYNGLESCLVLKVLQHSFFCVVQSKRNVYRFEKT